MRSSAADCRLPWLRFGECVVEVMRMTFLSSIVRRKIIFDSSSRRWSAPHCISIACEGWPIKSLVEKWRWKSSAYGIGNWRRTPSVDALHSVLPISKQYHIVSSSIGRRQQYERYQWKWGKSRQGLSPSYMPRTPMKTSREEFVSCFRRILFCAPLDNNNMGR